MENLIILIPLLPFIGFLVNGLFGKRLPKALVSVVACAGPMVAFGIAVAAFLDVARHENAEFAIGQSLWTWIQAGDVQIPFAFSIDRLSGIMALVVTGIGSLIHVYSTGYMKKDPGYAKFFAYLNLFMSAMLVLILGDNIVLMFLGWEGVGLCSYLLIGFWYKDLNNCAAGIKAFVVHRVGDPGFLPGIYGLFVTFGSFAFRTINLAVDEATLEARRAAKGPLPWAPAEPRPRAVSKALKAYAHLASSAAKGAVRIIPE